jgi:O-antigen/teichoic acid export membrane protein
VGRRNRLHSSISLLAIAYGIAAVANLMLSVSVGRTLGAAALGSFALALSVARVFYAAGDLGIAMHLTRLLSRAEGEAAESKTSLFLSFRLLATGTGIAVSVVIATLLAHEQALFAFVALAQGFVTLQSLYEAVFLARERQDTAAALIIVSSLCLVAGCVMGMTVKLSTVAFGAMYGVATVLGVVAWAFHARARLDVRFRVRMDWQRLKTELTQSWPIGISMLMCIAALRAPVITLGTFCEPAEVGAFAAADMFVTAALILQVAVSHATFPRLAASFPSDSPTFRKTFWVSNVLLALVGLVIALFLVMFGADVIGLLFPGEDFSRIRPVIAIIGWSAPCLLLVHHNIYTFAASANERVNLRLMTAWFVLIATFQVALVPRYGATGAAWGLLIGRICGLAVLVQTLWHMGLHRAGAGRNSSR